MSPPYAAWHLVAFREELPDAVSPIIFGTHPLVAVQDNGHIRVFDATCPHRGAHLGYGARIEGSCLVCPFHGRRIHLGAEGASDYRIAQHETVVAGDAVFVRFGDGPDHGLRGRLAELRATHDIVAALSVPIRVEPEMVVENAFDSEHFVSVHEVLRPPRMTPVAAADGGLLVESTLMGMPFIARAISPTLVVTQLGGGNPAPYYITGTVETQQGCIARVAIAAPKTSAGERAPQAFIDDLIAGSQEAFREDMPVWEHLAPGHVPRYDSRDAPVIAFRQFVATFSR